MLSCVDRSVIRKLFVFQGQLEGTLSSPTAPDYVHIFFTSLDAVSFSQRIFHWTSLLLRNTSRYFLHLSTDTASVSCRPSSHCSLTAADGGGPAAAESGGRPGGRPPVEVSGRQLELTQVERPL